MQCRPWPPAHRRDLRSLKECSSKKSTFRRHMNRYREKGQDPANSFNGEKRFLTGDSQPHAQEDDSILCSPDTLPPASLLGFCPPAWFSPRRRHYRQRHCKFSREASRSKTSAAVSPSSTGLMNSTVSSGLLMRDLSLPEK